MIRITAVALIATLAAAPVLAEPVTRSGTYDGPQYRGTWTATRDREAKTMRRDTDVFRKSDGVQVYDRTETVTRANGQVRRSVEVTRAESFNPERFSGRRR